MARLDEFADIIQRGTPLAPFTYLKLGGPAELLIQPHLHLILIVPLLEGGHFLATNKRSEVCGQGINGYTKVRSAHSIDVNSEFRLRELEVGSHIYNSGHRTKLFHERRHVLL